MCFLYHMPEVTCNVKSREQARVHTQEEIEHMVLKAGLAVFCLAAFSNEEEGLEMSSVM